MPVPEIEIPRFRHGGPRVKGGIGQGKGDEQIGQPIGFDPQEGEGPGAGDQPGEHILETGFTYEEIAKLMSELFGLPFLEPRGKETIRQEKIKYTGIYVVGPESLRHRKRTYKQTLKRELSGLSLPEDFSEEEYEEAMSALLDNPDRQVPLPPDKRYRSWKIKEEPEANAVIIYEMDVSGSMGDEQKKRARNLSNLFHIYIMGQPRYVKVQERWIIHDAVAREVDEETFFNTRESGGTVISSAYKLARDIIVKEYPLENWNIYCLHFSDGDNWSHGDNEICVEILEKELFPRINLFCYDQIHSPYGSGAFLGILDKAFPNNLKIRTFYDDGGEENYILALQKFLKPEGGK